MKKFAITAGIICLMLAFAPQRVDGQVIKGCYAKNNGQLRILAPGDVCKSSEVAIAWNEKGEKGDQGEKGEKGDPGAAGHTPVLTWSGYQLLIDGVAGPSLRGPAGPAGTPAPIVRSWRGTPLGKFDGAACTQTPGPEGVLCEDSTIITVTLPPDPGFSVTEHATGSYLPARQLVVKEVIDTVRVNSEHGTEELRRIELQRPGKPQCPTDSVAGLLTRGTEQVRFCVSASDPIYNVKSDPNVPDQTKSTLNFTASYLSDSLIVFETDVVSVTKREVLCGGAVVGHVHAGYGTLQLAATVMNINSLEANYVVQVTETEAVCIQPVEAKTFTVGPYGQETVLFDLRRCDRTDLTPQTLKVRLNLMAINGEFLDGVDVIFDWKGYEPSPAP